MRSEPLTPEQLEMVRRINAEAFESERQRLRIEGAAIAAQIASFAEPVEALIYAVTNLAEWDTRSRTGQWAWAPKQSLQYWYPTLSQRTGIKQDWKEGPPRFVETAGLGVWQWFVRRAIAARIPFSGQARFYTEKPGRLSPRAKRSFTRPIRYWNVDVPRPLGRLDDLCVLEDGRSANGPEGALMGEGHVPVEALLEFGRMFEVEVPRAK